MTDDRLNNMRTKMKEESKPNYMSLPKEIQDTPRFVTAHERGVKFINRAIERHRKGMDTVLEFTAGQWHLHGLKEYRSRIERQWVAPADGDTIPMIDYSDEEEEF